MNPIPKKRKQKPIPPERTTSLLNIAPFKIVGGVFSTKTFNNYAADVAKSGIQKYIRRGETLKAMYFVNEIELLKYSTTPRQKAVRTNMRNRLAATLYEDISPFHGQDIYMKSIKLLAKYEEKRLVPGIESFQVLTDFVQLMSIAKKRRVPSHLRATYYTIPLMYPNIVAKNKGFYEFLDYNQGTDLENFHKTLLLNDWNCFYWAFKIIFSPNKINIKIMGKKKTKAPFSIWAIFFKMSERKDFERIRDACYEHYLKYDNSRGENWFSLCICIVLYIHQDYTKAIKPVQKLDAKTVVRRNVVERIEVESFIIDKHTSQGRKMGKNTEDFVTEGSLVFNEDKDVPPIFKKFKQFYLDAKKEEGLIVVPKKTKNTKVKKATVEIDNHSVLKKTPMIQVDYQKLSLVADHTCCNKPNAFLTPDNKLIKQVTGNDNGRGQIITNELKTLFGLNALTGLRIVTSNTIILRKDIKILSWKNNMQNVSKRSFFFEMDFLKSAREVSKKDVLDESYLREFLKIGVFRGILRVTDFNMRNVLMVGKDLYSIDENTVGGKKNILGNMKGKFTRKDIDAVLIDINNNKVQKLKVIKETMAKFGYTLAETQKVQDNFNNLKADLYKEVLI